MVLYKFDHLRHCLRRQNWQQVGDQKELERLIGVGGLRLESAQSNALAIVRTASASVDKWGMEAMDVIMFSLHEESFSNSSVSVLKSSNVESAQN